MSGYSHDGGWRPVKDDVYKLKASASAGALDGGGGGGGEDSAAEQQKARDAHMEFFEQQMQRDREAYARNSRGGGDEDGGVANADRELIRDQEVHDKMHGVENPKSVWAVPRHSIVVPLRSNLLDPNNRNIHFPAQNLEELRMRRNSVNKPHLSYDIDGDGFVSQADLRIGKEIDLNKDGIIQENEKIKGKVRMARVSGGRGCRYTHTQPKNSKCSKRETSAPPQQQQQQQQQQWDWCKML